MFNVSWGQINSKDFGKIHNELVLEFLNNHKDFDLQKIKMVDLVDEFIKNFESKYPNAINDSDKREILQIFKNYSYASDFSYSKLLNDNKDLLLKNNKISKNIYDFLSNTDTKNVNFEIINNEISKYQSSNGITKSDTFAFEVANSVSNSSNELWNSVAVQSQRRRNHCNGRIIISDTGAALMWFAVPAVSLIAGGLSSLITAYSDGDCQ